MSMARKITVCFTALSMGVVGLVAPAQATVVSTEQMVATAPVSGSVHAAELAALFDRQDVVQALTSRGVDVAAERARVAALADRRRSA
jgi:surface antigen